MITTLVVDDSALTRDIIRDFLESTGEFSVIGEAVNGLEGLQKAQILNPDLITMDMEMPIMNGLEATEKILKVRKIPIVMITTQDSSSNAYEATLRGAMDFFSKSSITTDITGEQKAYIIATLKDLVLNKRRGPLEGPIPRCFIPGGSPFLNLQGRNFSLVAIASSTGGPKALIEFCGALPKNFPVPIAVVQHNCSGFDQGFAQWLGTYTALKVRVARESESAEAGTIYVAPTDHHLTIRRGRFFYDDGPPVNNQKPAADVLFRSAAEDYSDHLISVVLTGMGSDGAEGTRAVHQSGGLTIAQDEQSSMIYGMPRAAAETGCVDLVLPLDQIPLRLISLTRA